MTALSAGLASSQRRQLEQLAAAGDVSGILAFVGVLLWRWVREHWNDVIIRRKVLGVFSVTLRVRDLAPFLVALIGPEPPSSSSMT